MFIHEHFDTLKQCKNYRIMKAKQFLLIMLVLLVGVNDTIAQAKKHIAGISYGFQYKNGDIWVGDPYNLWIDQTSSVIIEGYYYHKLSSLFQAGVYGEFETGNFDVIGLPEQKAKRFGIGTIWLGHYPDRQIQFQAGGFFGFNAGFIDYGEIDYRNGIDYGIVVGPAIEFENFGLAVHHHSGFSWYPKDAEPDEFSYANTKIKIKVYYKF